MVSATHDRGVDYLEQVAARMPQEADSIWGPCAGYPGVADRAAVVRNHERHSVRTDLFVSAYPRATLAEVTNGLELRDRLGELAPRAQTMSPEELQAAFREAGLA
jgi:hypothetical protein